MNMKKTALAVALAGALGVGIGTAQASLVTLYQPYTYTGSNFSMRSAGGTVVGGTNDVSGSWDGALYNSQSDVSANGTGVANVTLSSPTTFFGNVWTAHNIQAFAPGTYTFTTDGNATTKAWDTTTSNGALSPTQTMTVGTGQVGLHMLFDWGTSYNIDVVDVTNVNANYASPFWSGGGTTSDWWSGSNTHIWGLASTGGQGMPNGPFAGYMANFNTYNGTNVAPVPIPAAAWLFGSGLIGLVGVSRRRRQNRQS